MIPIGATLDALSQAPTVVPKSPVAGTLYPIVGVLDTGIASNQFLQGWREPIEFTGYPQDYQDPSHGTFVAGIIEYEDELNHSTHTALQGVRLFDATVYPDEKKEHIYQDDLAEHIREAVERHSDIKIWNLSPSPFTRIGPGPGSIVKPDLVFYGGNAGMNNGKLTTTEVPSFTPDGKPAYNVGTGFSTPWVSRMAAEL